MKKRNALQGIVVEPEELTDFEDYSKVGSKQVQ